MFDAEREIIQTVLENCKDHPLLSQIEEDTILDLIKHLSDYQFKPDEKKSKKFIDNIVSTAAADLVRKDTVGE